MKHTSNLIKTTRIPRKPDNFSPSQTLSFAMYFAVSWLEPRLLINSSATEWTEDRTGPLNVSATSLNKAHEVVRYLARYYWNIIFRR